MHKQGNSAQHIHPKRPVIHRPARSQRNTKKFCVKLVALSTSPYPLLTHPRASWAGVHAHREHGNGKESPLVCRPSHVRTFGLTLRLSSLSAGIRAPESSIPPPPPRPNRVREVTGRTGTGNGHRNIRPQW